VSVGLLALFSWLATAGFGGFLVYLWAGRASRSGRPRLSYGRPPPYIPRWLVTTHVLLAIGGLLFWVGTLVLIDELAYVALPTLLGVGLLGSFMFLRWLGSRRARRAAQVLNRAPSESRLPTVVVVSHGLLGVTTVLLVLFSYFRPNGF
jgi:hypothetical protein